MKTYLILYFIVFSFVSDAQIISTFAGTGLISNSGDGGQATSASFKDLASGAFDKYGNYYISCGGAGIIRKISPDGIISAFAGNGIVGYSGDGGPATAAELSWAGGLAVDDTGNVYYADAYLFRIRKINITTGVISTIAGTGIAGYNGDKIAATSAQINYPNDICFDKIGNLYICEYEGRVRKIDKSGIITTIAGVGVGGILPESALSGSIATNDTIVPFRICTDNNNNLYISDDYARVYKVDTNGILTYFVGNGSMGLSGDGEQATAAKTIPTTIKMDKYDNLFVLEYGGYKIRMVDHNTGIISTVVGNGTEGFSGDGGPATDAEFNTVEEGITFDSCNNMYFCDLNNYRVRKITYPHCDYLETADIQMYNNLLSIYPNPAYNTLTINSNELIENIVIMNDFGQVVFRESGFSTNSQNNSYELNVSNWATGVYFVNINHDIWRRFVKE